MDIVHALYSYLTIHWLPSIHTKPAMLTVHVFETSSRLNFCSHNVCLLGGTARDGDDLACK